MELKILGKALLRADTWSNYKYLNTYKALVDISCNGIVTSVSSLCTLHLSGILDNLLPKCSGLLEKLELGDNIMAHMDRILHSRYFAFWSNS